MKRKKLVVISHTEHYKDSDGLIKGWGSTVSELDFLADHWQNITHVACLYEQLPPESSLPYTKSNIEFVAIPPYGGKGIVKKFLILTKIPRIIITVLKSVKGATEVQLRLPTSIGLFLLPIFTILLFRKFIFWVKYAGNWGQKKAPLSYRFQKWWLIKNFSRCKVTINGFWDHQPNHYISFENPCLTNNDLSVGKMEGEEKKFEHPFVFSFVGRIDEAKGILSCIEALKKIPIAFIEKIHFVGDGDLLSTCKEELAFLKDKVEYHGFLAKDQVHAILAKSHFILLPSKSEGFPKVIAEAACYGTIPIVSDVGSISHYVNEENGFVWKIDSFETYSDVLLKATILDKEVLKEKSNSVLNLAESFTFDKYLKNLENKIF